MKDFKELLVWQESKKLAILIYRLTEIFPKHELFGLTSQIRRAAVSVPSNIAEGTGRKTQKEAAQFCYVSRGSLFEVETQLIIALELNYLDNEKFSNIEFLIVKCRQLINGFINYLEK